MNDFFYVKPIFTDNYKLTGMKLRLYAGYQKYEDIEPPFLPYCFVRKERSAMLNSSNIIFKYHDIRANLLPETNLVEMSNHDTIAKLEFGTLKDIIKFKSYVKHSENIRTSDVFESDVPYIRRVMLDQNWNISKNIRTAYVDIEVDDSAGMPNAREHQIISIAVIYDDGEEVYLYNNSRTRDNEIRILDEFVRLMKDVAAIVTWYGGDSVYNPRGFDVPFLANRYKGGVDLFEKELEHLRYFDLYAIYKFELGRIGKSPPGGYSLDNVSRHEFGNEMRKIDKKGRKVSALPVDELKEYNLQDARIVKKIEDKYHFVKTRIDMARLTNSLLLTFKWDRKKQKEAKHDELKPLILTDQLLLRYSRMLGMVLPDREYGDDTDYEGAFVLEPEVGLYRNVQNYDIVQMYPSIMINKKISPDKDKILIPFILKDLMKKRKIYKDTYKKTKDLADYILQYNYKILANIIYGAFGNKNSRIYNPRYASLITETGRDIANNIRKICTDNGYKTIYQDTDSAFVLIDENKATELESIINNGIVPYKVELGEYYKSMLFLEAQTKNGAAKKKYAGIYDEVIKDDDGHVVKVNKDKMKIVGMESIKRDYCVLAKEAQTIFTEKILRMAADGVDIPDIEQRVSKCVAMTKKALVSGNYDNWLVISKGVKELSEYEYGKENKEHKGLPHIRAYKKLVDRGYPYVFDVNFVYTKEDVEPVLDILDVQALSKHIDRELYWHRQIFPIVNRVLSVVRKSTSVIGGGLLDYDYR